MKKFLWIFPLLMLAFTPSEVKATHYMGGEITWECTPQGNFRFTMIIYRECYTSWGNAATFPQTLNMQSSAPGFATIQMNRVSLTDMSPVCSCPGGPNIFCPGMPGASANMGAMHENVYTSDQAFPNGVPLTGVPPVTGWHFGYGVCCRNPCHNIQNAGSIQFYLRAFMYPYQATPVNTCFDNSPRFLERPSTVICTGYPYTYNHVAFDDELDSLVYEWAPPLINNINSPITQFLPGYSFNSPLPGTMHNANNVPATLNPQTGEISFTSYTNGAFVTVTKVTAYKCGIKVAEIFREMQVVLLSCGQNNPPNVTPPFQNTLGLYTDFLDTVYAGELVTFSISATNFQYCPQQSGQPQVPQAISLYAVGAQFGAPINQGGCLNPPCANLTPTPTWQAPLTGTFGVQTTFSWQTDCGHLASSVNVGVGCGIISNTYNFLFKVMDNFCPAPGIRFATVTIVVLTKPTLPSPPIHCLEVLANGDVALTWPEVTDTMNTFDSYHIWASSNPAGPFVAIDSIFDITTTTTTHLGAGAHTQPMYYYLTVRSGCNGEDMAPPYDTAQTIFLTAVNPGPAFGVADLDWNQTHDTHLPSASGVYEIYRDYPAGTWTMVGTTTSISHADIVTSCNDFISYRIEMVDTLYNDSTGIVLCRSISNVAGDMFADVTPPAVPEIYLVTVDQTTHQNEITWHAVPDGDAIGYVIYTQTGGVNTFLDTIWGRLDTVYADLFHDPCNEVFSYVVQSFDSCGNASAMSLAHNNLLLSLVQTPCVEEHVLSWNAYNNMTPSLSGYEVWVIDDHDQVTTLLTTTAPGVTSYTHSNLVMGREYCYMVRAVDPTGTKVSEPCELCNVVSMPNQPNFLYIKTATVENNTHVKVLLHTDISVNVREYELYRSSDGVNYNLITTLPPGAAAEVEYNDFNASFRAQSYYYMAVVIDSCGYIADTSNVARTIHLDINTSQQLKSNQLIWNDYEGFSGTPTNYQVWRRVDGVLDALPIAVHPPATGNHVDDVSSLPGSSGQFTYFIEAQEGGGNIYGFSGITSVSNEVQALMEPNIFIPSAFTPQGTQNNIFKPVAVYVPEGSYEFSIFNRYGQVLFTTTNREEGWDGTFNKTLVPEGVYVYVVRFISASRKEFERRGTVTVIR